METYVTRPASSRMEIAGSNRSFGRAGFAGTAGFAPDMVTLRTVATCSFRPTNCRLDPDSPTSRNNTLLCACRLDKVKRLGEIAVVQMPAVSHRRGDAGSQIGHLRSIQAGANGSL